MDIDLFTVAKRNDKPANNSLGRRRTGTGKLVGYGRGVREDD